MKQPAFSDQVKKHFHYLKDHGFVMVHEQTFPSFDNVEVVFQSEDCRIRVLRERGEVYVDISPLPPVDYWVDLVSIIGFLTQGADSWQYESSGGDYEFRIEWQLARVADKLRPYIRQVCELFRKGVFERKLPEIEEFKHQQFLEKWGKYIKKR